MGTAVRRADTGRPPHLALRWLVSLSSGAVAVVEALVAAHGALWSLAWGSDSGPFLSVFDVAPAVVSAAAVWLALRPWTAPTRVRLGVAVGGVGVLAWVAALVAAFRSESGYSSERAGADVSQGWVAVGALGALTVLAGTVWLRPRHRSRDLVTAAALVAVLWLPFAVARGIDNGVALPAWDAGAGAAVAPVDAARGSSPAPTSGRGRRQAARTATVAHSGSGEPYPVRGGMTTREAAGSQPPAAAR